MRKHALLEGSGGMPPRKIVEFRTSEITSARFSGQVSVVKIIHISSIQEVLLLLFSLFFRSRVDSFARGTNLKLRQANARHKQKLLGHVPGCAGAWLRHCRHGVSTFDRFH